MAELRLKTLFCINRSSQFSAPGERSSRRTASRCATSPNHTNESESQETVGYQNDVVDGSPESTPEGTVEQFSERESCESIQIFNDDFLPTPLINSSLYHDGQREQWGYDNRYAVPTQYPRLEFLTAMALLREENTG